MKIGIDVGGTFTDAVVLDKGHMRAFAKRRTTHGQIMDGLLAVLDAVCKDVPVEQIEKVTLSTTIVTNVVIEGKEEQTDLYVIPGPGRNVEEAFPVKPIQIPGYTDHQGRVVAYFNRKEVKALMKQEVQAGHRPAAVSAKFAIRNPSEEQALSDLAKQSGYRLVSEGTKLSGALHFPRRTVSAYFNSAVQTTFSDFVKGVQDALKARHIEAPLYMLKADGGSLPIGALTQMPVEAVFTGSAASVLGMKALGGMPTSMAVALDMGGTTTDISLWKEGQPIRARGGVTIRDYPSAVQSFQVESVGIGGESYVSLRKDGTWQVGPERRGPSMALGGESPTLGDALIVAGYADFGDKEWAWQGLTQLTVLMGTFSTNKQRVELGQAKGQKQAVITKQVDKDKVEQVAKAIIEAAVDTIQEGIRRAVTRENKRAVYTVQDIVEAHRFKPESLVGVGGTAGALAPLVAKAMHISVLTPKEAPVANAIGAALAKETVQVSLYCHTGKQELTVPELGLQESNVGIYSMAELLAKGQGYLQDLAKQMGIQENLIVEVVAKEDFPVLDGGYRECRIMNLHLQGKAGVDTYVRD